jgi:hypothetical protein
MDKVQKHNSFNTSTPSSESYRNYSQPLPGQEPPIIQPVAQRYNSELSQFLNE